MMHSDYQLPGPADGGMGPRQRPANVATGTSSLNSHTINFPSFTPTSTRISHLALSPRNQYAPGCVGAVMVSGNEAGDTSLNSMRGSILPLCPGRYSLPKTFTNGQPNIAGLSPSVPQTLISLCSCPGTS